MDISKLLLKDSSGKKSATMTAFVLGFIVVNLKFLFSGMTIHGFVIAPLSGVEYAAAVGALGSIYILRRSTSPKSPDQKK